MGFDSPLRHQFQQRKGGSLKVLLLALAAILCLTTGAISKQQCGGASWYGPGFHGKKTASGARFNQNAMTAAHRSLPFGTRVKVVNKKTGKSVNVVINDRGPFASGRIIDLSKAAATKLGTRAGGVGQVCIVRM